VDNIKLNNLLKPDKDRQFWIKSVGDPANPPSPGLVYNQAIERVEFAKKPNGVNKGYSDLRHGHPRAMAEPEVVEPTGTFHDEVTDGRTPDSQRILDHAAALDTTVDMLNAYPSAGQCLIGRLLFWGEAASPRLFGRLQHLHSIQRDGQKAQILEQLTVGW